MTSTRLPGKVLKAVLGKSLLEYQIERLRRVKLADAVVIATTTNDTDQPIVDLCNQLTVSYYRGSEFDVLERYYQAALRYSIDVIVRVTSDCPLIDPKVINQVIQFYLENLDRYDYVSNTLSRTYPRGMDTEVFSFQSLQEAFQQATTSPEREHVTPFIYCHPQRYRLGEVSYPSNQSAHRWTVDTPEDFQLIRKILEALYPNQPDFTLEDILRLLAKHPDWTLINSHIEQKSYGA
jgi:spore coat polysaccharide biosynthesis protein SpsF